MIESVSPSTASESAQRGQNDLNNVDMDEFLKLLLAELQNQDPMDPMKNSEMLAQIGQIREIGATDQLTRTLSAIVTGQNLTTASSLIGKEVEALSDGGEFVRGMVDRVSIQVDENDEAKRFLKVHIGQEAFDIDNVREITSLSAQPDEVESP